MPDPMNDTSPHIRWLGYLFKLFLIIITIRMIYVQIDQPYTKFYQKTDSTHLSLSNPSKIMDGSSNDEKRIAHHFIADTLPGLLRRGLIKKFGQNMFGTQVAVSGKIWKARSPFFKQSFLKALMVYDKVRGVRSRSTVVDSVSGNLYAEILSGDIVQLYD